MAAGPDRRWVAARLPSVFVFLAVGALYRLVSDKLTYGSGWYLLAVVVALVGVMWVTAARGRQLFAQRMSVGITSLLTAFVVFSTLELMGQSLRGDARARALLGDAVALWLSNVMVFGLWYWQLDGGGPDRRAPETYESSDFLFPRRVESGCEGSWAPGLVDYLFLAFTTATAFSPTDTAFLSKRMKVLLMAQATVSLLCISVLAARAINTL